MPPNNNQNNAGQHQAGFATTQDDRILLELLAKKLGDLAPLHGDVIKLLTTVDNMKTNETDLKKFKDKIMDPENGLFAKIQGIEHSIELVENELELVRKNIEKLPTTKSLDTTDAAVTALRKDHDSTKKLLEDVGGRNLEEIAAIVKLKANMSKVYWALIISAMLSFGKLLLDVFKTSH